MSISPTIPAEGFPSSVNDLWMVAYIFNADWSEGITNRSSYETDIQHARSASEQRFGLRGKPFRSSALKLIGTKKSQALALRMLAHRAATSRSLFPLVSDLTTLTAPASEEGTTLACDTTYRRIYSGMRIAVFPDDDALHPSSFEVAEVTDVADAMITISSGLARSYPAGAVVVPLIEARVQLQLQGNIFTDETVELTLEAIESIGSTQIPTTAGFRTIPDGFDDYLGFPIFDIPINYNAPIPWGVSRLGEFSEAGIDSLPDVFGAYGRDTFSLPILCKSRAEAWKVISLFDSRAGRALPFWLLSPVTEYEVASVLAAGLVVVVKAVGPEQDWTFRPYIGMVLSDGSRVIRKIASVVRNAGQDFLILDDAVPGLSANDIVTCTSAHLVRLDSDELEEKWHNTEVMETDLPVISLLEEKELEIANLAAVETSDLQTVFSPDDCEPPPCDVCEGLMCEIDLCSTVVLTTKTYCIYCGSSTHPNCSGCVLVKTITTTFTQKDIVASCPEFDYVEWRKSIDIEGNEDGEAWVRLWIDSGVWEWGYTEVDIAIASLGFCCDGCDVPSESCACCACHPGLPNPCNTIGDLEIEECDRYEYHACCPWEDGALKNTVLIEVL